MTLIGGSHIVVSGLVFHDGFSPTGEVISFRRSADDLANDSRITEIVIDNFSKPDRYETDYWVAIYGRNNRFDHNHLVGKTNQGVTPALRRIQLEPSIFSREILRTGTNHPHDGPAQSCPV